MYIYMHTYTLVYTHTHTHEICYEKLVHVIMGVGESYNLLYTN